MSENEPSEANGWLDGQAALMIESYRRWTGTDLIDPTGDDTARRLFEAPFALVSHGMEPDPIFNYGNRTALGLFEMCWEEFTRLPSRLSAEPIHRDERERLMNEVRTNGFIANYRGIRISKQGRRFRIERAIVWNLLDPAGVLHGQAAVFSDWTAIDIESGAEA